MLTEIAADESRSKISVGDLMDALKDRAMGVLIFVFAVPNAIPLPPGASSILGAPLLFLTAQMALGRRPWLPNLITRRSMDRTQFAVVVKRITPWLARAEHLLQPRAEALTRPPFEYAVGLTCLILAIILFLPIPMGNIPPAIAICIFALALLEGDGLWVIVGFFAAAAAVAIVWGVLLALIESAVFLVTKAFS